MLVETMPRGLESTILLAYDRLPRIPGAIYREAGGFCILLDKPSARGSP